MSRTVIAVICFIGGKIMRKSFQFSQNWLKNISVFLQLQYLLKEYCDLRVISFLRNVELSKPKLVNQLVFLNKNYEHFNNCDYSQPSGDAVYNFLTSL